LDKFETETAVSTELILHNAKIATNGAHSFVEAIAVTAGKIAAIGKDDEIRGAFAARRPG
jgi:predicted amidohydrolase YtcJ